ncbi:MAG TPA: AAA family ATPase, partial [Cellvibrionaceae bacterium]|nr:AAA family ATPase [Cellvibrionaceae bacterium]
MYHSYFGIEEQAFSIAVNPRYLYMSAQHREALAHLLYGVNSGGFVMLTGEVGTGKTTIIRCLLEQLPKHADVAMIMTPAASARDLLCSICDELAIDYLADETSLKILTDKLYEFLLTNHSKGRNTIVLIDEAQLLRVSTLEQIRLLTNLESNTQKLLQIILVGQPELNELLAKPALRQLSQRITARYHLRPLSQDETGAYIKHRLQIAGMPPGRQPFP